MGKAICRTCGGETPNHIPSILDKDGIGNPAHKMNNQSLDRVRNRKLEGDIHALLMDFRNACLEARSELHQTGNVDITTNKIIVAQAKADIEIQNLINSELQNLRQQLARGIEGLRQPDRVVKEINDGSRIVEVNPANQPIDKALAIIKGGNENG